jgi:hypothetical protein
MQDDAPPGGDPTASPTIPPAARWALIVVLPSVGFTGGALVAFGLVDLQPGLGLVTLLFLSGVAGAVLSLGTGLVAAPWLPAGAGSGPSAEVDHVPPAPHPTELSWVGPAAALLVGLCGGVVLGAGLMRQGDGYGYYGGRSYSLEPFTRPAVAVILSIALAAMALFGHRLHGEPALPAARAPLHRVVLRCLLRALVVGVASLVAAIAGAWVAGERRYGDLVGMVGLSVAAAAGALTLAETVAWRVRSGWRWGALVGIGAALPLVAGLFTLVVAGLLRRGDPIAAASWAIDGALQTITSPRGGTSLAGAVLSTAAPFTLLAAARTGDLPYFGRRAPWPLGPQIALGWACAALLLASVHFTIDDLRPGDVSEIVTVLVLVVPAALVALRLCDPLERRLASRWVLLTGGGRD